VPKNESVRWGKRVTTRPGASTGNVGGLSAPGAPAEAAPPRAGRGGRRRAAVPASVGRWLLAVTRVFGTAPALRHRYWAQFAILCVIFTAGFSLRRHPRTRRSVVRGPDKD